MSVVGVAFVVGPWGAVVVVPLALVLLAFRRCPRWAVRLGRTLALIVGVGWLGYWVLWQLAFGYADAYQPVPATVDIAKDVAMAVAAVGCVGLALIAVTAVVLARRQASR